MKPPAFDYSRPESLDDALMTLARCGEDASVLSGGQSLMPLLNMRLARPEFLIDINRVPGLADVEERTMGGDAVIHVGALVRAAQLERHARVLDVLPVVSAALGHVGHPQIRNRTTVGGNIAHADPSSELPGVLAALDGSVVLSSLRGSRIVGWEDFFVSVFMTAREPDELLTEVRLPVPRGWTFRFSEFARRHGDFPIVAMTVGTRVEAGRVQGLRISVTGVGERVTRLRATESAAVGQDLELGLVESLAQHAMSEVSPGADSAASADFRRHLVATLLRRQLMSEIEGEAA